MFKLGALLIGLMLIVSFAQAGEITDKDAGTYVLLNKERKPTEMFYRLSKNTNEWVMDGKKGNGEWKNISCATGCNYRKTTDDEIITYFPPDWRANVDIGCIQNIAQAFCRFNPKGQEAKNGYVVIALVTGKPIPMFIRRIDAN